LNGLVKLRLFDLYPLSLSSLV